MNIMLLQWGLLSFMLGLVLSLPLAAVHYQGSSRWTAIFTNPRKLKSAHLDFFTQAFAAGFVYLIEYALQESLPHYVLIPLVFGTICNPLLLLIEATPLNRQGFGRGLYLLLRATSPLALLFAWFYIAWIAMPTSLLVVLGILVAVGLILVLNHARRQVR